jgi:hypothetical protein
MAKQKLIGGILLVLGIVVGIAGLVFFLPFGWILLLAGVVAIVYGRDMMHGVTGTLMEHLSGKKFREHKKTHKK